MLREKENQGNNFDLNKIISIFDSDETYKSIKDRYPELTDDLLHLMPTNYTKGQLGQLISAIWSKYLSLQGGDVATQKQLLDKDRQIFQKEKIIQDLKQEIQDLKSTSSSIYSKHEEFERMVASGAISKFIQAGSLILTAHNLYLTDVPDGAAARSLGLIAPNPTLPAVTELTPEGQEFFKWLILKKAPNLSKENSETAQ